MAAHKGIPAELATPIWRRLEDPSCSESDARRVAKRCREIFDLDALKAPAGYRHGSLCVIDAIWSIGSHYSAVENVVRRYCDYRGIQPLRRSRSEGDSGAEDSIESLAKCGQVDRVGLIRAFGNDQRTSPRGGILKSDAVIAVATALVAAGVKSRRDLRTNGHDPRTCAAWTGVHGQASAISFVYGRMLAGEDDVKPDRMVLGFVGDVVEGRLTDPCLARAIVRRAGVLLQQDHPGLTMAALDAAVWRHQAR